MRSQVAKSKWSCRKCGVSIPYNPTYSMEGVLCATCQCYDNADRLLKGYRMPLKK